MRHAQPRIVGQQGDRTPRNVRRDTNQQLILLDHFDVADKVCKHTPDDVATAEFAQVHRASDAVDEPDSCFCGHHACEAVPVHAMSDCPQRRSNRTTPARARTKRLGWRCVQSGCLLERPRVRRVQFGDQHLRATPSVLPGKHQEARTTAKMRTLYLRPSTMRKPMRNGCSDCVAAEMTCHDKVR